MLASGGGGATPTSKDSVSSFQTPPTFGYWKIRGLAAACRMMFFYKKQKFIDKSYGEDAKDAWFGKDKPTLAAKNSLINLPYIEDSDSVVTQSNSCLVYLGQKLGVDKPEFFIDNHMALDQTIDLRNDLMKICYGPAGKDFKKALEGHMGGAATHLKKLNSFCHGPYMCGKLMQSADFHVFEMLDQHITMCKEMGVVFDLGAYPKLAGLHATVMSDPELATYFASPFYTKYAFNNAMYANFVGSGYEAAGGKFGPSTTQLIDPSRSGPIKVYYWPFLGRGASLVRMLEHTGTDYEYHSDRDVMSKVCSVWDGDADTFAPPVVVDGDIIISQSTAACLYVGKAVGLTPPNFSECKAVQFLMDIVDVFEGGLGKNNEEGPVLKKWLEGDRWRKLLTNLERGIQGPFYFGSEPCCVDFFLAAQVDFRTVTLFSQLKAKLGLDVLAKYPKISGIYAALSGTEAWKTTKPNLGHMKPVDAKIIDSYYS